MPTLKFQEHLNSAAAQSGGPSYIKCNPFSIPESFATVVTDSGKGKPITRQHQKDFTTFMVEDQPGWITFVTGATDMTRLYAWFILNYRISKMGDKGLWCRINGSRFDPLTGKSQSEFGKPSIYVADSLLTHSVTKRETPSFDPIRLGKISDLCNSERGRSSILVICPELTLTEATNLLRVEPDMSISLKRTAKSGDY